MLNNHDNDESTRRKRDKQQEYAIALQQQMNQQKPNSGPSLPGGGNLAITGLNDNEIGLRQKKAQQQEYAAALRQQMDYQQQHNNSNHRRNDENLYHKEERGQPYSFDANNRHDDPRSRMQQDGSSYSGAANIMIGNSEKDNKRAKQQEYAAALAQQLAERNQNNSNRQHGHVEQGKSPLYNEPAMNNNNFDPYDSKQIKRLQQAEYARALAAQMQDANHRKELEKLERKGKLPTNSPDKFNYPKSNINGNSNSNNNVPQEGWVIGPLGLPVRRTVEVGNRGLQRLINQTFIEGAKSPTLSNNAYAFKEGGNIPNSTEPPRAYPMADFQPEYPLNFNAARGHAGFDHREEFNPNIYPNNAINAPVMDHHHSFTGQPNPYQMNGNQMAEIPMKVGKVMAELGINVAQDERDNIAKQKKVNHSL
jgi:hypothetical protein